MPNNRPVSLSTLDGARQARSIVGVRIAALSYLVSGSWDETRVKRMLVALRGSDTLAALLRAIADPQDRTAIEKAVRKADPAFLYADTERRRAFYAAAADVLTLLRDEERRLDHYLDDFEAGRIAASEAAPAGVAA